MLSYLKDKNNICSFYQISERILSAANVEEAKGNFRACVGCGRRELVVKNYEENVEKLSPSSVLSGCHNHNQQQSSRCVRRRTVSFNRTIINLANCYQNLY